MMGKRDDPAVFDFFNEIGIIGQLSQNALERALPGGLKMSHFVVLNHFARLGGARSPQDLARALQVTKGAMTNTLKRLEARGLVEVRPDPDDGRGKRVTLTDAGSKVRNEAIQAIAPSLQAVGERFTQERLKEALPLLREVRQYLDKTRDAT
jgi:DNA-binding MarR family transcriptional regulator